MKRQIKQKTQIWKIRLLIALVLFLPLKAAFDVFKISNYKASNAYVSFSPDGKYKSIVMVLNDDFDDFWISFALGFGDYENDILFAIADASTGEMLAFYHPPNDWRSSGAGGHWTCEGEGKKTCISYRFPYFYEIPLPLTWWQRTHAKLTVKIKGLENPEFKKVTVYE
ncbi:MAG: hypothetical protein QE278_14615 [Limnobacter sp.]|nr:hypothetical protein [Limnobacter sp.]